jgi:uncharacterized small protein (DUF1192 family)
LEHGLFRKTVSSPEQVRGGLFGIMPRICYGARGHSTDDGVQRLIEENTMSNGSTLSLPEIEDRIAILRDNIRQLIEQAAGSSGAEDEARNADRIAQQTEELEKLNKQRDAMLKKK